MFKNSIINQDMEHVFKSFGKAEKFEGATVLITGGGGFLGHCMAHFFMYLRDRGVNAGPIIVLDTFILGRPDWARGLQDMGGNIKFYEFDISHESLSEIPGALEADYIIHMASIASPVYYRKYPVQTLDANVLGLRNLLEFYKSRPIKGLLFFSSSEIYGDPPPESIPTPEHYRGNVSSIGPRACYNESKRFGETQCYVYATTYGMPLRIVRPFNDYGPGMKLDDGRVAADFASAVLNGTNIVMYSDGTATRTFGYVADSVAGYLKVLTHGEFDCFNIGSDDPEISIKDLAAMFRDAGAEVMGYSGDVVFDKPDDKDYSTDNPSRRCPDLTKSRKLLGFEPGIKLDDGIRRFLRYFKEERG